MKILLVEHDILLSKALAELLRANHYTIDLANDRETGLYLAISAEYDLILLDWLIPKVDGINLCRQLRSQGYSKPILLLTANNCNTSTIAGLDAGADDYLLSNFSASNFLIFRSKITSSQFLYIYLVFIV